MGEERRQTEWGRKHGSQKGEEKMAVKMGKKRMWSERGTKITLERGYQNVEGTKITVSQTLHSVRPQFSSSRRLFMLYHTPLVICNVVVVVAVTAETQLVQQADAGNVIFRRYRTNPVKGK